MSSFELVVPLIDDESQALLSGIGNHEAKSLLTAAINSQPTIGFSVRQLEREMLSRQGDAVAWRINSGTVTDYLSESLSPIGAVAHVEEAYGTRTRKVYSSSEFGIERALPFAGAIMEWSLAYPENSVQKLLGITAVAGQSTRAPVTSYAIMQDLLTRSSNAEISVASVSRSIGQAKDLRIAEDHLHRLVGEQLVVLRTVIQDYNPLYRINREKANKITLTHDVSSAIRDVWLDSTNDEMTLAQILELISEKYPNLAADEVRRLMTYVVPKQRLPFLEVTNRNGAPLKQSDVKLTDKGREIMGSFVDMVEASEKDEQGKFRKLAVDGIADTNKFRILMNKARTSSSAATTVLSHDVILDEIKSAGEMTVTQLRESLATKAVKVSTASVRRYLNSMSEEGLLQTKSIPLSSSLKRKATHYQVADK